MCGSSYRRHWRQETRLVISGVHCDQRMEGLKNQVGIERRGHIESGSGEMGMKSDNFGAGRKTCPVSRIIISFYASVEFNKP